MKRKITSLLMAVIMTLSLAVPAFASSNYFEMSESAATLTNGVNASLEFKATTRVPKISLYMPVLGTNPVVFNPYKIKYDGTVETDTLNGDNTVGGSADQYKQIISPVYAIGNMSDTELTVGVQATTTVEGNLTLTNTVTPATETGNKAAITVKFVTTKKGASVTLPNTSDDQDITATTLVATADRVKSEDLVLTAGSKAAEIKVADNKLVLPVTDGGESFDATKGNYLLFQFVGDAASKPTKPWTAEDKFTTTMVFTFQPSADPNAGATAATTPEVTGTISGSNATFTITAPSDVNTTTPGYTATNVTFSGTGGTIALSDITGYTSAANDTDVTMNITITYNKGTGTAGDGSFQITLKVHKPA